MASGRAPQRSCIACRRVRPKQELLRVVRTPRGEIAADPAGKTPGRGAYICPAEECFGMALKQRKFDRALGKRVEEESLARIAEMIKRTEQ